MLKEIDTVRIPEWALCALINGDTSGLTGSEENNLEVFLLDYDEWEGLVFVDKGEPYFSWTNDVDHLGGNVYDVTIYGHPMTTDETRSYGPWGARHA